MEGLFKLDTHVIFAGPHLASGPPTAIIFQGSFTALRLCSRQHILPMVVDAVAIPPKGDSFEHNCLHMLGAKIATRIVFSMLLYSHVVT